MRAYSLILLFSIMLISGCARFRAVKNQPYETIKASPTRNAALARRNHAKAIEKLSTGDTSSAEQLVNQALIADRDFGPAHNTLGRIYFDQEKHYLAAWEFEYASRLMPNRSEPTNNLGMVMESVGQYDDAIQYYQSAFDSDSENSQYLGNLIRARVRRGDSPIELQPLLKEFILLDSRQSWVDWAKSLLVKAEISVDQAIRDSEAGEAKAPQFTPEALPIQPADQQ